MAGGSCLFVEVGVLLVEARSAGGAKPQPNNHYTQPQHHKCQDNSFLCERAQKLKRHMGLLSENRVPMCIDVFLCPDCPCGKARARATNICSGPSPHDLLLEQWTVSLVNNKSVDMEIDGRSLLSAIRSQLHFSQLGAWASLGKTPPVCYRLSHPGTPPAPTFTRPPTSHHFPLARTPRQDIYLKVSVDSLPRMEGAPPTLDCPLHSAPPSPPLSTTAFTAFKSVFAELGHCLLDPPSKLPPPLKHGVSGCWREKRTPSPPARPPQPRTHRICRPTLIPTGLVDDRLQSGCQHIGKHHCQEEDPPLTPSSPVPPHHHHPAHQHHSSPCSSGLGGEKSGSSWCSNTASPSSSSSSPPTRSSPCSVMKSLIGVGGLRPPPGLANSIISVFRSEVVEEEERVAGRGLVNPLKRKREEVKTRCKKLLAEQDPAVPPDPLSKSFGELRLHDSKTPSPPPPLQQVIPCPLRKHHLALPDTPPLPRRSPPGRRSGAGGTTDSSSEEADEWDSSPPLLQPKPRVPTPASRPIPSFRGPLLGSFEESILCNRLRAVREVGGYTADLGASGTFCPRHLKLPARVSFYPEQGLTSPYMGVAKLSHKGYHVPRSGTIQATLINPLGTVIRMFVVPYDLSDIPPNSQTFIRQRILNANSTLRYLIHIRFSSSKSGRVIVHTDLRMIIARQYDTDASMDVDVESNCDLKSVIVAPSNPKYSKK